MNIESFKPLLWLFAVLSFCAGLIMDRHQIAERDSISKQVIEVADISLTNILETPFVMSTNITYSSTEPNFTLMGWTPPLPTIESDEEIHRFEYGEEGVSVLSLTADHDILVYGELIGRIVGCKFIPFQK